MLEAKTNKRNQTDQPNKTNPLQNQEKEKNRKTESAKVKYCCHLGITLVSKTGRAWPQTDCEVNSLTMQFNRFWHVSPLGYLSGLSKGIIFQKF